MNYAFPESIEFLSEDVSDEVYAQKVMPVWQSGQSGSFTGVDDVEIQYRYFRSDDPKPAIVISNGRTECMLKYQEMVYDLTNQGCDVYLWDHRGQGHSGKLVSPNDVDEKLPDDYPGHASGHVEEFDHYVDDLKTYVDQFIRPAGHPQLFLLAHSMGGCIASLFLEKYRKVFNAAVLCSPMHQPGTGIAPTGIVNKIARVFSIVDGSKDHVKGKRSYEAVDFKDNKLTHSQRRYKRMLDQSKSAPETQVGGPSHEWLFEAIEASEKARRKVGKIQIPVLLIQAGGDQIVKPGGQEEFCENLNDSHPNGCQFLRIENAQHELFVEIDEYRNKTLNALLHFFKEHT